MGEERKRDGRLTNGILAEKSALCQQRAILASAEREIGFHDAQRLAEERRLSGTSPGFPGPAEVDENDPKRSTKGFHDAKPVLPDFYSGGYSLSKRIPTLI
jgi:hypothetical protein